MNTKGEVKTHYAEGYVVKAKKNNWNETVKKVTARLTLSLLFIFGYLSDKSAYLFK